MKRTFTGILSRLICPHLKLLERLVTLPFLKSRFMGSLEASFTSRDPSGTSFGTAPNWAADYRFKIHHLALSQGVPEEAGMGRKQMKLTWDWGPPWRGIEARVRPLKCWPPLRGRRAWGSPRL